ncbi:GIY-YIG nuclease family protein [Oscillospiraceae bacterium LTW-04]|nr:GIY-YIG nuclease family protein [Oscillospiraceae bacterium MB24-C1]
MDAHAKKALKTQYKNRTVIGGVFCIRCEAADAAWIRSTTDMQGSKNRFSFSCSTNSCPETCMAQAWKQHGASAFSFEVLEEIKKKEAQTDREFSGDVAVLLELWSERRNAQTNGGV